MKAFKIWCEINEIRDKVLAKMESEGILWNSSSKPTEYTYVNNAPTGFYVTIDKRLSQSDSIGYFERRNMYTEITPEEYLGGKKQMKKSDLKTGYIVTTREGEEYMVYLNVDTLFTQNDDIIVKSTGRCWNKLQFYKEDLTYYDSESERYDIVKVEKANHPYCLQDMNYDRSFRETLWEREEPKEMTVAEIEKLLGYPVKIVK